MLHLQSKTKLPVKRTRTRQLRDFRTRFVRMQELLAKTALMVIRPFLPLSEH